MNYKQSLDFVKNANIEPYKIEVASAVEFFAESDISDEDFEKICQHSRDLQLADDENHPIDYHVYIYCYLRSHGYS